MAIGIFAVLAWHIRDPDPAGRDDVGALLGLRPAALPPGSAYCDVGGNGM